MGQASRDHASDVAPRLEKRHFEPHPGAADRSHDSAGRAAIHYQVERLAGHIGGSQQRRAEEPKVSLHFLTHSSYSEWGAMRGDHDTVKSRPGEVGVES